MNVKFTFAVCWAETRTFPVRYSIRSCPVRKIPR